MVEFETDYTLLSFQVGEYQFCVPASEVIEVVYSPKITKIIATPDFVVGTFLTRGVLASAINLRRKFSLTGEDNLQSCFIISKLINGNTIAIEVDSVGDVFDGGCLQWQVLPSGTVSRVFDKCTCYNDHVVFHSSLDLLFNYCGELRTAEMNYVRKLFGNEAKCPPKVSTKLSSNIEPVKEDQQDEETPKIISDSPQCLDEKQNNASNLIDLIANGKLQEDSVGNVGIEFRKDKEQQSNLELDLEIMNEVNIPSETMNNLTVLPVVIGQGETNKKIGKSTKFEIIPYGEFLNSVNSGAGFKFDQSTETINENDDVKKINQGNAVNDKPFEYELIPYKEYLSSAINKLDIGMYKYAGKLPIVIDAKVKNKREMEFLQQTMKNTLILPNVITLFYNKLHTLETEEQDISLDDESLTQKKLMPPRFSWGELSMFDRLPLGGLSDEKTCKLLHDKSAKSILLLPLLVNEEIPIVKNQLVNSKFENIDNADTDTGVVVCDDLNDMKEIKDTSDSIVFDISCDPVKKLENRRNRMIAAGLSATTLAIIASMGIYSYSNQEAALENYVQPVKERIPEPEVLLIHTELKQDKDIAVSAKQVQEERNITEWNDDKAAKIEVIGALVPTNSIIEYKKNVQIETIVHQPTLPVLPLSRNVHNVVKGDTLWFVAKQYLNNPFLYPKLADYNEIPDPNLIYPGDKIRILSMDENSN